MNSMTCKALGGACEQIFSAKTFEDIAALSQQQGKAMFETQDADCLAAMQAQRALMEDPQAMAKWFESKRGEFNALPDD